MKRDVRRMPRATAVPALLLLLCGCGDAPGALRVSSDSAPADERAGPPGCVVERDGAVRYRVVPGDTLSAIARKVYGDADLWPEIARANAEQVGADGSVAAGALLVIPFEGR